MRPELQQLSNDLRFWWVAVLCLVIVTVVLPFLAALALTSSLGAIRSKEEYYKCVSCGGRLVEDGENWRCSECGSPHIGPYLDDRCID